MNAFKATLITQPIIHKIAGYKSCISIESFLLYEYPVSGTVWLWLYSWPAVLPHGPQLSLLGNRIEPDYLFDLFI